MHALRVFRVGRVKKPMRMHQSVLIALLGSLRRALPRAAPFVPFR